MGNSFLQLVAMQVETLCCAYSTFVIKNKVLQVKVAYYSFDGV